MPVRVGLTVSQRVLADYRQQPALFAADLKRLGYTALTPEMLQEIMQPVYTPFAWDLQLDVFADGSLGSDLGLGYYFNRGNKQDGLQNFQTPEFRQLLF